MIPKSAVTAGLAGGLVDYAIECFIEHNSCRNIYYYFRSDLVKNFSNSSSTFCQYLTNIKRFRIVKSYTLLC